MILYTVQHKKQYLKSIEKGYLEGDKDYICEHYIDAYHWMMSMMSIKMVNYGGEYPVWYSDDIVFAKDILTENDILLEIELDNNEYLVSDFNSWHCVLNDYSLTKDEEEFEEDILNKEESWERIFDLDFLNQYPEWIGEPLKQYVSGKIDIKRFRCLEKNL